MRQVHTLRSNLNGCHCPPVPAINTKNCHQQNIAMVMDLIAANGPRWVTAAAMTADAAAGGDVVAPTSSVFMSSVARAAAT